jgi:hypothetical protein
LPRPLESLLLRDQAEDLLTAPGVIAVDPPKVPYGALLRMPPLLAARVARRQARRIARVVDRHGDRLAAITIFHPVQAPVARALQELTGCELWYGRWDRYEEAYDADTKRRARLRALHQLAAENSSLTFVASGELQRLEQEAGREATLVPLAADSFPAPDPDGTVVALSLGHLGWRTDWALLRAVGERLGERLVLLLVGEWHDNECSGDADYRWCREHPGFVWLGSRSDEEAARLLLCADVGIVPFAPTDFNNAGLPFRILKAARLGRRTVTPELDGVKTWDRAVVRAADAEAFAAALVAEAGRRTSPDLELRAWALEQTADAVNAPLWARLRTLGVVGGRNVHPQ